MSNKPKAFEGVKDYVPERIARTGYLSAPDRTHDGDTFLTQVSIGIDLYPMCWIRIFNLLAPELNEPGGAECRDAMGRVLQSKLVYVKMLYRSFDRWVSVVREYKTEKNVADQLIADPLAGHFFTTRGPLDVSLEPIEKNRQISMARALEAAS